MSVLPDRYEMVIGLEVHTHLKTDSKLFSPAPVLYGEEPNHSVHWVDLALPGVLPVLNERVVELAIRLGTAIHATVNPHSVFARKNYFYPDLPKGYQISQYEEPVVSDGWIEIDVPQALLAAQAPGPLPEGYAALNETAWYEDRPGQFRVVGDEPDMGGEGEPDGGIGMGGVGGAPSADGGVGQGDAEPSGCAVGPRPGSAGWLSLLLGLGLLGWRRRRSE